MIQQRKLLLCLCTFVLTVVQVEMQSQQAACSSCPSDATGCDVSEKTSPDTTTIISTVKCTQGSQLIREFQTSRSNPNPGTQMQRTFHRSVSSSTNFNTYPSRNSYDSSLDSNLQDPFYNQQNFGLQSIPSYTPKLASGSVVYNNPNNPSAGRYTVGSSVNQMDVVRNGQFGSDGQRQIIGRPGNTGSYSVQGSGVTQMGGTMRNGQFSSGGQSEIVGRRVTGVSSTNFIPGGRPANRCDPCPYDATGCEIREETTPDTENVITTTSCLDSMNKKMTQFQTTTRNPNPGTTFARRFHESHQTYTRNY